MSLNQGGSTGGGQGLWTCMIVRFPYRKMRFLSNYSEKACKRLFSDNRVVKFKIFLDKLFLNSGSYKMNPFKVKRRN